MSTDNSKPIRNTQNDRTTFSLKHSLKTTSRFGSMTPTLCKYVLPADTIQNSTDMYLELKPTVSKLNTTIQSNLDTYFVPLCRSWKYWENFLAKTGDMIENGGTSMPSVLRDQQKTANYLPSVCLDKIPCYFLATLSSYNGTIYNPEALLKNTDGSQGNVSDYDFSFINNQGKYVKSFFGAYPEMRDSFTWWLPRLIQDGVDRNPMYNLNVQTSGNIKYFSLNVTDPEIVGLFNYLGKRNNSAWNHDWSCVKIQWHYRLVSGVYYVLIRVFGDDDNYTPYFSSEPSQTTYRQFSVRSSGSLYGGVEISNMTPPSGDENRFVDSSSSYVIVLLSLLNHSSLIGHGSLIEALGCPMFKYVDYSNYGVPTQNDQSHYMAWFPTYASKITLTPTYVSALPFYSYQGILNHYYLLPHNVLSNNSAQDSTVNTTKFDSPYFRNYLVPDMCYELEDNYLTDLFKGCYLNDGALADGTAAIEVPARRANYAVTCNQLLTIFLDRAHLIDVDMYTRTWQKENMLVQNVVSDSGLSVVDSQRRLDVQKMLMAKRTARAIRFGGQDQDGDSFLENHYGVITRKHEKDYVMLSHDSQIIMAEDVLNTGGAVDTDGSPMSLGQKTSVVSQTKGNRGFFEYYAEDFGYVIQLHFLMVANDWFDAHNCDVYKLESNSVDSSGRRQSFEVAYLPEFADTGDDVLYDTDIDQVGAPERIGYTNKNFWLKDSPNIVRGDYGSIYRTQVISPVDPNLNKEQVSLSYSYLQKPPHMYSANFVDQGDNILLNMVHNCYRKSTQTKLNSVGLDI